MFFFTYADTVNSARLIVDHSSLKLINSLLLQAKQFMLTDWKATLSLLFPKRAEDRQRRLARHS